MNRPHSMGEKIVLGGWSVDLLPPDFSSGFVDHLLAVPSFQVRDDDGNRIGSSSSVTQHGNGDSELPVGDLNGRPSVGAGGRNRATRRLRNLAIQLTHGTSSRGWHYCQRVKYRRSGMGCQPTRQEISYPHLIPTLSYRCLIVQRGQAEGSPYISGSLWSQRVGFTPHACGRGCKPAH